MLAAALFKEDPPDTFTAPTFAPVKRSATVVVEAPAATPSPTPPPTLPPVAPTPVPSGMTPAPPTQPPRTVPPYTPPPARRPAEIDCKAEPHFCTPRHHMETENGELVEPLSRDRKDESGEDALEMTMSSQIRRPDRLPAATGDEVGSIRVEVTVENNTRTNYYFVERKVVLQVYKNGEPYDQLATTGDGFVMTPTGRMTATFERPITKDGKYTWEAKIWYYSR